MERAGITRKDFIKALGAFALLPDGGLNGQTAQRDRLEQSIERRFHIDINTASEAGDLSGSPRSTPDVVFNTQELITLEKSLVVLPRSMYDYDKVLQVTCLSSNNSLCLPALECGGYATGEIPRIAIVGEKLAPVDGSRKEGLFLLAHELTHVKLFAYEYKPNPLLNDALGEDYTLKSARYIESYRKVADPITAKYENEQKNNHNPEKSLSKEELELFHFIKRLRVGFTDEYGTELSAVLAEFYVRGKDWFFHYMDEVFSEDTDNLYDYCREYIFDKKEYDKLPVE